MLLCLIIEHSRYMTHYSLSIYDTLLAHHKQFGKAQQFALFGIYLDHAIVLDCLKDCDFRIMDVFMDYFYCYYTAWNEGFFN